MAMSTVRKAGKLVRSFYPISSGLLSKTSGTHEVRFWKNALVVRACSGGVLQRIEKKQDEALVGGGQKRIDTQHRKVRLTFEICFTLFSFGDLFRGDLRIMMAI